MLNCVHSLLQQLWSKRDTNSSFQTQGLNNAKPPAMLSKNLHSSCLQCTARLMDLSPLAKVNKTLYDDEQTSLIPAYMNGLFAYRKKFFLALLEKYTQSLQTRTLRVAKTLLRTTYTDCAPSKPWLCMYSWLEFHLISFEIY